MQTYKSELLIDRLNKDEGHFLLKYEDKKKAFLELTCLRKNLT